MRYGVGFGGKGGPVMGFSIKQPWDPAKREAFETRLSNSGWVPGRYEGVILGRVGTAFEKGDLRLLVDNWGLFVFERDSAGRWHRTRGLADDQIALGSNRKQYIGPFSDGLFLDIKAPAFVKRVFDGGSMNLPKSGGKPVMG
jgi:hypothetical protein